MTDETTSEFALVLKDEISPSAKSASASLAQLRGKIDADVKALRGMQAALSRMKAVSGANGLEITRLKNAIAAQRSSIANAQASYVALGGTFGDTADDADDTRDRLGGLIDALKHGGGPVGHLAGRLGALANPITAVVAIATVGIGVLVAFAGAVVGAAIALGRLALASADARRSELLHLEGLTTLRNAFGVAAGSATELQSAIDRVSDSSALSRTEVAGMAEQLYRAGLRGGNLSEALEGLSIAQSVQGDRGAARFRAMAVSIARTGGSVHALADDIRARLGGIASRQALGLERQMERLHESVARIFGDVRIDGFLRALHQVTSLFSQSTASGRALHTIVTTLFSPLFDQTESLGPVVRRFFQGMVIAGLHLTIALLRIRNELRTVFSKANLGSVDAGAVALRAGAIAVISLASGIVLLARVVVSAIEAWVRFKRELTAFRDDIDSVFGTGVFDTMVASFADAGRRSIMGLLDGMFLGLPSALAGIGDIAGALADRLTSALDIHSPSRVFARIGAQIPQGLAVGIRSSTPSATGAVDDLAGGAEDAGPNMIGAARGAMSVTFGEVHVHLGSGGAEAGREAAQAFVDQVATLLEGVRVELGA